MMMVLSVTMEGIDPPPHLACICLPLQVDVRVHTDPESGVRGLAADRSMSKGELLVSIPAPIAIPLGMSTETAPVSETADRGETGGV